MGTDEGCNDTDGAEHRLGFDNGMSVAVGTNIVTAVGLGDRLGLGSLEAPTDGPLDGSGNSRRNK